MSKGADFLSAYDRVRLARAKGRPTAKSYIHQIFSGFIQLHGDRRFGDDPAVIGGVAVLKHMPVTVIGIERGTDTKSKLAHHFGSPNPEGYRKALRLMKQAEKFKRPVICFVDTAGAYCGIGAEERGQGQAIAENIMEMMGLRTQIISIFIGEGGSGGALALAAADQVWMLENAIYSVISPEGCASILWKDAKQVEAAAENLKLTAEDLLALGVADRIFQEPVPGEKGRREEGLDFEYLCDSIREALWESLSVSRKLDMQTLLELRYERFRRFGKRP